MSDPNDIYVEDCATISQHQQLIDPKELSSDNDQNSSTQSFYSYMQENEIDEVDSSILDRKFDKKRLVVNNKVNENMTKLLSLKFYKLEPKQPK